MITLCPSSRPATTSVVVPSLSPTRIGWSTGSPASSTRTLAAVPPVSPAGGGDRGVGGHCGQQRVTGGIDVDQRGVGDDVAGTTPQRLNRAYRARERGTRVRRDSEVDVFARLNDADVAFIDLRLHLQRVQVAQDDGPAAKQLLGTVDGLLLAIGWGARRR